MPYILEFYSLDWSELGKALGSGDRELLGRVDLENGGNFFRGPEEAENRLVWRKVVEALVAGRRGKALAARGPQPGGEPEEASDLTALALVGLIRTLGVGIGELEHSTASGPFFREDFFERQAPALLGTRADLTRLLSRPLFGLAHETYPSWGGLAKAEIKAVLDGLGGREPPAAEDSDVEGWLYDLHQCLLAAHEEGTDIVTVYT